MYIDTSGVRYTKPIDGLNNLPKLEKINLLIGPEATMYTNSKAIRIGDRVDENGNVIKSNILKPFNDALATVSLNIPKNVISSSLTWEAVGIQDESTGQYKEIYMSKIPYHSFDLLTTVISLCITSQTTWITFMKLQDLKVLKKLSSTS